MYIFACSITYTHTDRQPDRQVDRRTARQPARQTYIHILAYIHNINVHYTKEHTQYITYNAYMRELTNVRIIHTTQHEHHMKINMNMT